MPNWKKVITSGSDAALNSLYAPSITGSLLGTASYATQALSASYAPGGGVSFPYTGSAEITGSLGVTGSLNLQTFNGLTNVTALDFSGVNRVINDVMGISSIDADGRTLSDGAAGLSVDWENRTLANSSGVTYVDWENRYLYGPGPMLTTTEVAVDWSSRQLTDNNGNIILDWQNATFTGTASFATSASWAPGGGNAFPYTGDAQISGSLGVTGSFSVLDSIDGANKILIGSGPIPGSTEDSVNWDSRTLFDSNGNFSVRWGALRTLFDSSTVSSLDWGSRIIYDSNASQSVDWNNRRLKFDNGSSDYTVDWNSGILQDTTAKTSVDWQNRQLKNISGNEILNWSSGVSITGSLTVSGSSTFTNIGPAQFSGSFGVQGALIPGFPPFIPDTGPYDAIKVDDVAGRRLLYGSPTIGASASVDFGNRTLLDNAGNSAISWDGTVGYINSTLYSNNMVGDTTRNTLLTGQAHAGQTLDEVTFDSTVADSDLVYLSTGSTWFPVNQATDSSTKLLGICLGYDPMTYLGTVILEGDVSVSTSAGSAPVVDNANYGLPVYIAYGAGNTMDTTIPVNGYVRVLGHCYHNDGANNWIMKFRPSNDWVVI